MVVQSCGSEERGTCDDVVRMHAKPESGMCGSNTVKVTLQPHSKRKSRQQEIMNERKHLSVQLFT